MSDTPPHSHISRISTMWSVLRDAQGGGDQQQAAQALLVECYGPAVRRYLMALTRDANVTDELWQQFMMKLLDGSFRHVSPEKGRFRAYVKVTLFHLVGRESRRVGKSPPVLSAVTGSADKAEPDQSQFDAFWRQQLLDRVWNALADAQPRYFRLLSLRKDHPELSTEQLADSFRRESGDISDVAVRKLLSRARERFANLLLNDVARSVDPPTRERVEDELGHLELLEYCRPVMTRWASDSEN